MVRFPTHRNRQFRQSRNPGRRQCQKLIPQIKAPKTRRMVRFWDTRYRLTAALAAQAVIPGGPSRYPRHQLRIADCRTDAIVCSPPAVTNVHVSGGRFCAQLEREGGATCLQMLSCSPSSNTGCFRSGNVPPAAFGRTASASDFAVRAPDKAVDRAVPLCLESRRHSGFQSRRKSRHCCQSGPVSSRGHDGELRVSSRLAPIRSAEKHPDTANTSTRREQVRPQPTRLRVVLVFTASDPEECSKALLRSGRSGPKASPSTRLPARG